MLIWLNRSAATLNSMFQLLDILVTNPRVAHNNHFYDSFINFFLTIKTNLIKNNVFDNHIFIYYRNNHKCNIKTIINHKYKFCHTKIKIIKIFSNFQKTS